MSIFVGMKGPDSWYVTVDEAAVQLDMTNGMVRGLIRRGEIRARRVGRIWIIPREEIARFVREVRGGAA